MAEQLTEQLSQWLHNLPKSMFGGEPGAPTCTPGTRNIYQMKFEPTIGCVDGAPSMSDRWFMATQQWMSTHYEVPLFFSIGYLIVVYGIQHLMKNRAPFSLRPILIGWNFLLALFSIVGSLFVIPTILLFVLEQGHGNWATEICTTVTEGANPWVFYFIISKIPELLDTLWLALRKRPIIFLHSYHHVATMFYCWDAWSVLAPAGGPFAAMNLFVHSIMYSYYFVMASGTRVPSSVASVITTLQIVQMFGGIAVLYVALTVCPSSSMIADNLLVRNYIFGLLMYISYAVLFLQFFIKRYVFPSSSRPYAAPEKIQQASDPKTKKD